KNVRNLQVIQFWHFVAEPSLLWSNCCFAQLGCFLFRLVLLKINFFVSQLFSLHFPLIHSIKMLTKIWRLFSTDSSQPLNVHPESRFFFTFYRFGYGTFFDAMLICNISTVFSASLCTSMI